MVVIVIVLKPAPEEMQKTGEWYVENCSTIYL
jgi:hypothetical protein